MSSASIHRCGPGRSLHKVERRQREMCIGDRSADDRRGGQAGALVAGSVRSVARLGFRGFDATGALATLGTVESKRRRRPRKAFRSTTAVSYTHLRAHEDGLALGCRFLHEK